MEIKKCIKKILIVVNIFHSNKFKLNEINVLKILNVLGGLLSKTIEIVAKVINYSFKLKNFKRKNIDSQHISVFSPRSLN